ncbi:MAG TPA: helix-turn-helix domain-containing protein [Terriglobales bacterium]|jgi:hypothetical protein|nr:helix-turn-helix domain-containing protein [Terriglobales bacterium]
MEQHTQKKLRSLDEGALQLGISRFTLYGYARRGLVQTVMIGRRRLISENELSRIAREGVATGRGSQHETV